MASTEPSATARTSERRRDLDLLRVVIVFGLVFFHTLRVFDMLPWDEGVKNQPPSAVATLVTGFLSVWGMPLLFVIAGFGIWHSLSKRTPGLFLRERVDRLLVPLVFGTLIVVPWQMYFHLKQTDPAFQQTFWQYLPSFFDVTFCREPLKLFVCADPATELFGTAHLWFLRYLFVLSVVLLPLLLYLRSQGGARVVGRFTDLAAGQWAILLLALPLALAEAVFRTTGDGGWNAYAYTLFILYGFLFAADRRFWTAMGRAWRNALAIGLAFSLIYVGSAFVIGVFEGIDPGQGDDWGSILSRAAQGIAGWAMIVAILGFGARPRRVRTGTEGTEKFVRSDDPPRAGLGSRLMVYAAAAFLPFYILHQTVIIGIGYFVVQWPLAGLLKYFVISLSSLALSLLIYEVAIRRTRPTRWMFGMKAQTGG